MKEILSQTYSRKYSESRCMDIFIPETNPSGICILFIHGGGWCAGNKASWHPVAKHFCQMGYTCASAEYRLAPDSQYPSQVEDVRLAMSYLKERAAEYKFGPQKVAAMGSSSGAHLVLMLATIKPEDGLGYTEEMNIPDTRPCLAVCYCPVTTVHLYPELWQGRPSLPEFVGKFMGTEECKHPELFKEASPTDRIRGGEPPVLFVHGDADTTVPLVQSKIVCDKIRHFGGTAQLAVLPGVRHGFGYGVDTPAQKEAIKLTEEFLKKHEINSATHHM